MRRLGLQRHGLNLVQPADAIVRDANQVRQAFLGVHQVCSKQVAGHLLVEHTRPILHTARRRLACQHRKAMFDVTLDHFANSLVEFCSHDGRQLGGCWHDDARQDVTPLRRRRRQGSMQRKHVFLDCQVLCLPHVDLRSEPSVVTVQIGGHDHERARVRGFSNKVLGSHHEVQCIGFFQEPPGVVFCF